MRKSFIQKIAKACLGGALTPAVLLGQTAARQAPVEFSVPVAPTPVVQGDRTVLAYELHITNFGQQAMALQAVEVFSSEAPGTPIAILADSSLRGSFQIGARMRMNGAERSNDTLRLNAGEQAVVFVWLTLTESEKIPRILRHRLRLQVLDGTDKSSVIDSLMTPVNSRSVLSISPPMRDGVWLGEGPSNTGGHRRSLIPVNGKAWLAQRFAIDWVRIGENGNLWHDDRLRNDNFWGFGEAVLAVTDADVVAAVDSFSDNVPGQVPAATLSNIAGNFVILRLGEGEYAMYGHLKQGSILVRAGQHVRRGETIGRLGNSGQSTAPHLHFQVMNAPSGLASEGIPFVFDQFMFQGYGRDYEPGKAHPLVSKRKQLPEDDAIAGFTKEVKP